MKVLMLIKKLDYSGAPKMFLWLATNLANMGFEITIFTYMKSNVNCLPSIIKWINCEQLENKSLYVKYKTIREIIKRERYDCSISFLLDANFLNIISCLLLPTKSIVCERNDPFKPGYYKLMILKPFFRFADGAVFQLEKVKEYYNNIKVETAVIPNPVTCQHTITLKSFTERDNVIVTVGRLDVFQKRQDVLIKAFALFVNSHPNFKLHIYGDGDKKNTDALKNLITNLDLNNKVFLKGTIYSPLNVIKDSKIFVFTSDFEGIPNSLIEAMSIGLPCIATDCRPGGARLLIKDGVNGYLVKPGDIETIAQKMCHLIDNPKLGDSIGENARNISTIFSENNIICDWINYLKKQCNII